MCIFIILPFISDVDNTIVPSLHDSADCRILELCNVSIPTTVKVTGYGDLTSKEDIRLCLANQTEGKVLKVDTPFKENAFIVTFEKYQGLYSNYEVALFRVWF